MTIQQPLTDRMRPNTLDEMVGQQHLLGPGRPLYQIIQQKVPMSLLLWGPPGCGKSTYAHVLSKTLNVPFEYFNASIQNKAQLQKLTNNHPQNSFVLLLDEIHRLTTPIQDFLLPYVESGHIILVGTTTENPIMAITPALRSRCQIYEFEPVQPVDIEPVIKRACKDFLHIQLDEKTIAAIAQAANGDVRVSINILDTLHTMYGDHITFQVVEQYASQQHLQMDKKKTNYYDYLSAFSGSVLGSDTDAALYYLAVLLKTGNFEAVIRRIRNISPWYVGLANPGIVNDALNLVNTAEKVGMPEGRIHVAMAAILLSVSPKSDAVTNAIDNAMQDADHFTEHPMPHFLRDAHYKYAKELRGAGFSGNVLDHPNGIAHLPYMPKDLIGHHYLHSRQSKNDQIIFKRYQQLFEEIYQQPFK